MRAVFLLAVLALLLGGCGRKGWPSAPGPADQITYPKVYPTK
jgi:predicted small lipoprotein YifL